MEFSRISLSKGIALSLFCMDMDHHRPGQFFSPLQHIAQPGQIMSVNRPEVGKAHILEQRTAGPQRFFQFGFQPVVKPVDGRLHRICAEQTPIPLFKMIVRRLCPQLRQMTGKRPDIWVDGHSIVIHDYN